MAGSIIVSKELRFPVSSLQFDYLAERIRAGFDFEGQAYLKEIYSPMDEGGMDFISVKNENEAAFKSFVLAVLKAKEAASTEDSYATFGGLWEGLLAKIRLDERYRREWESPEKTS